MSLANVLVVGPHPDDQELGMGGTIARLARAGHRVHLLDMTNGEPTPLGSPELRQREWEAATGILDGGSGNLTRENLFLPNRSVIHSLEARHKVAAVMRQRQSDWVFCPYFEDAHPDHVATTRIVEDARFDAKLSRINLPGEPIHPRRLFYYYCTHLKIVPNPTLLIDISGFEDVKEAGILAYHTQFVLPEQNAKVVQWVRHQNAFMGSRLGVDAAEPFFLREPLGLSRLDGIL